MCNWWHDEGLHTKDQTKPLVAARAPCSLVSCPLLQPFPSLSPFILLLRCYLLLRSTTVRHSPPNARGHARVVPSPPPPGWYECSQC